MQNRNRARGTEQALIRCLLLLPCTDGTAVLYWSVAISPKQDFHNIRSHSFIMSTLRSTARDN